jgi:hypothetical protein
MKSRFLGDGRFPNAWMGAAGLNSLVSPLHSNIQVIFCDSRNSPSLFAPLMRSDNLRVQSGEMVIDVVLLLAAHFLYSQNAS